MEINKSFILSDSEESEIEFVEVTDTKKKDADNAVNDDSDIEFVSVPDKAVEKPIVEKSETPKSKNVTIPCLNLSAVSLFPITKLTHPDSSTKTVEEKISVDEVDLTNENNVPSVQDDDNINLPESNTTDLLPVDTLSEVVELSEDDDEITKTGDEDDIEITKTGDEDDDDVEITKTGDLESFLSNAQEQDNLPIVNLSNALQSVSCISVETNSHINKSKAVFKGFSKRDLKGSSGWYNKLKNLIKKENDYKKTIKSNHETLPFNYNYNNNTNSSTNTNIDCDYSDLLYTKKVIILKDTTSKKRKREIKCSNEYLRKILKLDDISQEKKRRGRPPKINQDTPPFKNVGHNNYPSKKRRMKRKKLSLDESSSKSIVRNNYPSKKRRRKQKKFSLDGSSSEDIDTEISLPTELPSRKSSRIQSVVPPFKISRTDPSKSYKVNSCTRSAATLMLDSNSTTELTTNFNLNNTQNLEESQFSTSQSNEFDKTTNDKLNKSDITNSSIDRNFSNNFLLEIQCDKTTNVRETESLNQIPTDKFSKEKSNKTDTSIKDTIFEAHNLDINEQQQQKILPCIITTSKKNDKSVFNIKQKHNLKCDTTTSVVSSPSTNNNNALNKVKSSEEEILVEHLENDVNQTNTVMLFDIVLTDNIVTELNNTVEVDPLKEPQIIQKPTSLVGLSSTNNNNEFNNVKCSKQHLETDELETNLISDITKLNNTEPLRESQVIRKKRGRPRIHPIKDPQMISKKRGRPRIHPIKVKSFGHKVFRDISKKTPITLRSYRHKPFRGRPKKIIDPKTQIVKCIGGRLKVKSDLNLEILEEVNVDTSIHENDISSCENSIIDDVNYIITTDSEIEQIYNATNNKVTRRLSREVNLNNNDSNGSDKPVKTDNQHTQPVEKEGIENHSSVPEIVPQQYSPLNVTCNEVTNVDKVLHNYSYKPNIIDTSIKNMDNSSNIKDTLRNKKPITRRQQAIEDKKLKQVRCFKKDHPKKIGTDEKPMKRRKIRYRDFLNLTKLNITDCNNILMNSIITDICNLKLDKTKPLLILNQRNIKFELEDEEKYNILFVLEKNEVIRTNTYKNLEFLHMVRQKKIFLLTNETLIAYFTQDLNKNRDKIQTQQMLLNNFLHSLELRRKSDQSNDNINDRYVKDFKNRKLVKKNKKFTNNIRNNHNLLKVKTRTSKKENQTETTVLNDLYKSKENLESNEVLSSTKRVTKKYKDTIKSASVPIKDFSEQILVGSESDTTVSHEKIAFKKVDVEINSQIEQEILTETSVHEACVKELNIIEDESNKIVPLDKESPNYVETILKDNVDNLRKNELSEKSVTCRTSIDFDKQEIISETSVPAVGVKELNMIKSISTENMSLNKETHDYVETIQKENRDNLKEHGLFEKSVTCGMSIDLTEEEIETESSEQIACSKDLDSTSVDFNEQEIVTETSVPAAGVKELNIIESKSTEIVTLNKETLDYVETIQKDNVDNLKENELPEKSEPCGTSIDFIEKEIVMETSAQNELSEKSVTCGTSIDINEQEIATETIVPAAGANKLNIIESKGKSSKIVILNIETFHKDDTDNLKENELSKKPVSCGITIDLTEKEIVTETSVENKLPEKLVECGTNIDFKEQETVTETCVQIACAKIIENKSTEIVTHNMESHIYEETINKDNMDNLKEHELSEKSVICGTSINFIGEEIVTETGVDLSKKSVLAGTSIDFNEQKIVTEASVQAAYVKKLNILESESTKIVSLGKESHDYTDTIYKGNIDNLKKIELSEKSVACGTKIDFNEPKFVTNDTKNNEIILINNNEFAVRIIKPDKGKCDSNIELNVAKTCDNLNTD